jgi:hypothetical protein
MRIILFYFVLALMLLSSCDNGKENSSNEQEEFIEIDEYTQGIRENKKNLRKAMIEKRIKLTINGPCDDAIMDTIHERRIAYIDSISINKNIVVTFKFIEACCQEFLSDYTIHGDTMAIELGLVNEEVCSCLCWYRYRFETPIPEKKIRHIEVNVN